MILRKLPAVLAAAVIAAGCVPAWGGETEVSRELTRRASGAAMEIYTDELDWSCYDQSDGGQLHSDRFCVWQGRSVPGDGNATYYMSHSYTEWGKQIAALDYDDIITVDGSVYVVDSLTPLWYSNEEWIFDACVPNCYNGCGDGMYLQTCIHNEYGDIVIVHASPRYDLDASVAADDEPLIVSSDIYDYVDADGIIEEWGR